MRDFCLCLSVCGKIKGKTNIYTVFRGKEVKCLCKTSLSHLSQSKRNGRKTFQVKKKSFIKFNLVLEELKNYARLALK